MAAVASRAYLKRTVTEKRRRESSDWWAPSIESSRGYLPPKTPGFRPELHRVRKVLASRYYRLMMGHAVIAPYLKYKIKTSDSDTCCWCDIGIRQSREHLFQECLHWKREITELWRRVQRESGWRQYRWRPISALFNERKATAAWSFRRRRGRLAEDGGTRMHDLGDSLTHHTMPHNQDITSILASSLDLKHVQNKNEEMSLCIF
jgi:hypothetical protein